MTFTSEISDLISRIKVAHISKDLSVRVRLCKTTLELSVVLKRQGLIQSMFIADSKTIVYRLKYKNSRPLIREIKPVSTPGRRVFWSRRKLALHTNKQSLGSMYILSTPVGLRTSSECLTTSVAGGEVLLYLVAN